MPTSAVHKGWLFKHNEGLLVATYIGAKNGATAHGANTALAGVFLGTPVTNALAVDSIVVSGQVASGDYMVALNRGGNSEAYIFADASAGTLYLYAPNGAMTLTPTSDVVLANGTGLIVGATTQVTVSDGDGATNLIPELQVLGTAAADGSLLVASFNTTNTRAVSPHIALVKGAAATQVATTAVADNEVVGSIIAYGSDSADFETPVAAIEFVVDDVGAPGAGAIGGSLEFYTTADGGETLTLALTLNNTQDAILTNGGILVGSATQVTVSDGDGATNLIPEVQAMGVGTAFAGGAILAATFNTTNTRVVSPKLILVKGAAATQVATTAVADNEVVGSIIAYGSDSADFETPVGAIEFVVDDVGAPGAGAIGGSIEFYTTADGGETLTLALTLTTAQDAVLTNGGILVGSATQVTVSDGGGATNLIPEIQALGVGTAFAGGTILAATFNATNDRTVSPKIALVKGAAATQVATTAVADNEVVGSIIAYASDSADFETPVGAIEFVVDDVGAPGAGAIGGSIEFYTTADGGETLTIALTLSTAQLATFAGGIQGNTRVDVGITGTTTGIVAIDGATSGTVSMTVAATAGTWTFTLPATAGEAGDALFSDGTGISSWVSSMRSVDVQLTDTQLRALLGTDVTLVAAPGANRAVVVHAIYMFFDVTTTAYTINAGGTTIGYASDGESVAVVTEAGFLDTVADAGRWYLMGGAAATPTIFTPVANAAIVIRKATADMTGGNAANTLSVRVYYSVVDTVAFT